MAPQYPIRKKRKADNSKRFILAAQELFGLQGYEATTMEGIAEHAGLHVQTLYRHFKNKVELAAAGDQEQLTHFRNAIQDAERNDTTIQFWRKYIEHLTKLVTSEDGGQRFRQIMHEYAELPGISSHLIKIGEEYEVLLSEHLERDINLDDPHERREAAHLIAITLRGAHDTVVRRNDLQEDYDLAHEAVAIIDRVEQLYKHVLK